MSNARKVAEILATEPGLSGLRERLQKVAQLQELCRRGIPHALRESVSVGEPIGNELRLFANDGAAAAKLRHLTPELLAFLNREGWQFTGIRVAVQVRTGALPGKKSKPKQIDDMGQTCLARLAESLPEAPLRRAIERLRRNAGGKP
jgi:hypothetical protein